MNKDLIKKIAAAAAAVLMVGAAVSCEKKSSGNDGKSGKSNNTSGNGDVTPVDIPDGSSTVLLTKSQSGVDLQLEYNPAHIDEDEGILIARYFYSISTKDAMMTSECVYKGAMESLIAQELITNAIDYTEQIYNMYKEYVGADYELNYVVEDNVNAAIDFNYYDEMIQSMAPDAEIEDRKAVALDLYYKSEDQDVGSGMMRNRMNDFAYLVLYKIDGQYYVIG